MLSRRPELVRAASLLLLFGVPLAASLALDRAASSRPSRSMKEAVGGWLAFVNPTGFSGDACNSAGGCARRFAHNGCGGMDERDVVAAR